VVSYDFEFGREFVFFHYDWEINMGKLDDLLVKQYPDGRMFGSLADRGISDPFGQSANWKKLKDRLKRHGYYQVWNNLPTSRMHRKQMRDLKYPYSVQVAENVCLFIVLNNFLTTDV